MSDPSIYVVVPNWNGKDLLSACLDSLQAQSQQAKIVVVDNGSNDGSQHLIKKSYPDVELIVLDKNYGFAGGVNAGIKAAMKNAVEFVALFNNDAIAEPDWLTHLAATANEHPETGIITGKLLLMDKKHLDSTGDFYSIWGLPFPRGRNEVDHGQYNDSQDVFGASGGGSLYRIKMLEEIGLFDEDFFAYYEDVDISFRAQLAGWRVRYEPQAVAYHHRGVTSSKHGSFSRFHSNKNFILLYTKNMPLKLYLKYFPLFTLQWLRWLVTGLLRGQPVAFFKGWLAALWLLPKSLAKRQVVQGARKVSVSYIETILYHKRPPRPPKLGS